jgi:aspartate racemase
MKGSEHTMTTLGILGGLGPMSSVYFYELLTAHTRAACDQEHLNLLISSRADTPDRTAFILGQSTADPLPVMAEEAVRLARAGADLLAIPCNTAHAFYAGVQAVVSIPILNIIEQNAAFCRFLGVSCVGILATEGTIAAGAYQEALTALGIEYLIPDTVGQATVSHIIYDEIKRGRTPDVKAFLEVADKLFLRGCDRVILGCTELSLLKRNHLSDPRFIDSMEVLALSAIRRCGKEPVDFDADLMQFLL